MSPRLVSFATMSSMNARAFRRVSMFTALNCSFSRASFIRTPIQMELGPSAGFAAALQSTMM